MQDGRVQQCDRRSRVLSTITSGIQLVYALGILLLFALPTLLTIQGNRQAKKIHKSLQEENGGSSVRDSLDRIESALQLLDRRVAEVELAQAHAKGRKLPFPLPR